MSATRNTDSVATRREGWGSLRKLPSGQWQARYPAPDGETYTARTEDDKPLTFLTKTDARTWLASVHTKIAHGEWEPPSTLAARRRTVGIEGLLYVRQSLGQVLDILQTRYRDGDIAESEAGGARTGSRRLPRVFLAPRFDTLPPNAGDSLGHQQCTSPGSGDLTSTNSWWRVSSAIPF